MEPEKALRKADNKVVIVLGLVFGALVFLIGVASNDVPSEVPMVQSSFDVAPPIVTPPTSPDGEATPQLAHVAPTETTASTDAYLRYADEAARGARRDAQH